MAIEFVAQRLETGDVVLLDLGEGGGGVAATVVRNIDRTDTTVRATMRVEGREDFVKEWHLSISSDRSTRTRRGHRRARSENRGGSRGGHPWPVTDRQDCGGGCCRHTGAPTSENLGRTQEQRGLMTGALHSPGSPPSDDDRRQAN